MPGRGLADPELGTESGVRGSTLLPHPHKIVFLFVGERIPSASSGGRHRSWIGEMTPGRPLYGGPNRRVLQMELVGE
ncbi:hypothetical protein QQM39_19520 [Streptomyces sp. DT2A-34]|uniref:hypothetical protein n=1 Tax=Streptomyces sp. DT2A-34 TaxID=3051182 RepID=UPI00265BFB49|nr:hypothetical protein [Streptomyces sp. DT2A-34]MDO0912957.1 hypothetical protein [Streptomyces sp. DT2A-34]